MGCRVQRAAGRTSHAPPTNLPWDKSQTNRPPKEMLAKGREGRGRLLWHPCCQAEQHTISSFSGLSSGLQGVCFDSRESAVIAQMLKPAVCQAMTWTAVRDENSTFLSLQPQGPG